MINVTPDHPIAHEAYDVLKNMKADYVNIIAHTFQKSASEQGFFIAGIYPNSNEGGFNRLDWLTEYELLLESKNQDSENQSDSFYEITGNFSQQFAFFSSDRK